MQSALPHRPVLSHEECPFFQRLLPTITMTILPRSMTIINCEFERLKDIREICFDEDVIAFLQDA
ncbi:unnamed protein product [Penicillium salamii]|nr:unnamed protein product [Penicillium salamii]CAG8256451.1 unnamed protein product [Penicillium salamii]